MAGFFAQVRNNYKIEQAFKLSENLFRLQPKRMWQQYPHDRRRIMRTFLHQMIDQGLTEEGLAVAMVSPFIGAVADEVHRRHVVRMVTSMHEGGRLGPAPVADEIFRKFTEEAGKTPEQWLDGALLPSSPANA